MQVIPGQQQKNVSTRQYRIETSHGSLAVEESGQGEIPVLMIHGNSFCRGIFRHQMHSSLVRISVSSHSISRVTVNPAMRLIRSGPTRSPGLPTLPLSCSANSESPTRLSSAGRWAATSASR